MIRAVGNQNGKVLWQMKTTPNHTWALSIVVSLVPMIRTLLVASGYTGLSRLQMDRLRSMRQGWWPLPPLYRAYRKKKALITITMRPLSTYPSYGGGSSCSYGFHSCCTFHCSISRTGPTLKVHRMDVKSAFLKGDLK